MNITELDKLPDFEDLDRLIQTILELTKFAELLDLKIKATEAAIITDYTSNPLKFVAGKPISITQLKATVAFTGEAGELIEDRAKLAQFRAELDSAKLKLQFEKTKIDIWRTKSANERLAIS